MLNGNVVTYWLSLSLYQIASLISFTLCCVSIWRYYLELDKVMKWIQYGCIFCSIMWMIAAIAWNVNNLSIRVCFSSNSICDQIYFASVLIAIYGASLGNFGFISIFMLRLINLFQDSAFEITTITKTAIQFTAVFGMVVLFGSALLHVIHLYFGLQYAWFISMIMLLFCTLLYIIASIVLLKLMINKIRMFTQFTVGANTTNITNDDSANCFNEKQKFQISNYFDRLTKRLTVLYSIALFSSLIVECITAIFFYFIIMDATNGTIEAVFFENFRLLLMIDTIINSICLLLQSQNATKEYYRVCSGCERCIICCCFLNRQKICNCCGRKLEVTPMQLPTNVADTSNTATDE